MQFVSDLHLHSKYSRAVSRDMVLPIMAEWGKKKGIDILTTGDWTHPLWLREIRGQLEEKSEGLYGLKSEEGPLFLLSTEISSIYKQGDKLRRIHNLVFVPNFEIAEKVNKNLLSRGCNLMSDGRPIIGLTSKDLLEFVLSIEDRSLFIPCHVWTPHFGIYGSASGFDSLEEAFGNLTEYVYGIETGLSSDPEMNWQMRELQNRSILSFSDAHSPAKMGREATVFELEEPSYENIRKAIVKKSTTGSTSTTSITGRRSPRGTRDTFDTRDTPRIIYTIEFYPEEGKYHFSGHRNCAVVRGPEEIRKDGNICSVCKRQLTEGVLYRVSQLGDKSFAGRSDNKMNSNNIKWYIDKTKNHPPYVKLVPLLEIVAEGLESTVGSQKVKTIFDSLCEEFGSEVNVLLKTPIDLIQKSNGLKIAEGIEKVREGNIVIDPGFDGEYGKVKIWNDGEQTETKEANVRIQLGLGF